MTSLAPRLLLLGSLAAWGAPAFAAAAGATDAIAVVAEAAPDLPGAGAGCAVFVAGQLPATDPGIRDAAPAHAAVAAGLAELLHAAHLPPAGAGAAPSVLVIVHWGVLHRVPVPVLSPAGVDPNLHARLALVATDRLAGETENFFLSRVAGRPDPRFATPGFLSPAARRVVDLARTDRAFVVVTAYEAATARRLWRVKSSRAWPDGELAAALGRLLQAAGPWAGRNADDPPAASAPGGAAAAVPGLPLRLADPRAAAPLARAEQQAFGWIPGGTR